MEVKSFITHPSFGHSLKEPGFYEISGVAYSGTGRIAKVMVSADGGKSWGEAALQGPVHAKAFTRFVMPWRWDGQPAILQSRAWDEAGNVQPLRAEFVAARGETREAGDDSARLPQPALQQPHELGHRQQRGDQACLCISDCCAAPCALRSAPVARSPQSPKLGKPISEADIKQWDIAVLPDGTNLPPGSGTPAQGAKIFAEKCVACHGEGGKGGAAPGAGPLVGGAPLTNGIDTLKTIGNYYAYATTVFDYIRRAMPFNMPRSLTRQRSLCAHRLHPLPSTSSSARTT